MCDYMVQQQREHGTPWSAVARHMLGLRNGLPGARRWRQVWSDHKLKGLDPHEVMAVLRLGALGFVPKASSAEVMEHALRLVLAGDTYLPSHILLDPQAPAALPKDGVLDLTQRQKEVMRLMVLGESNKQIARRLNLAENTVKVHVTAILRELNVTSRAQAIVALFQRDDGPS